MPTLLVLAAGPLQLPAVTTAKRMGLRVVAADGNPKAPGLAIADTAYVFDIRDPDECLRVAKKEKIDGVVHICCEVSMYAMGRINEKLGLHGIDSATAIRATNKEKMRLAFEAAGVPSPKSFGAATEQEALAAAEKLGLPLIVKPSRNSGSRGVTLLGERAAPGDLLAAYRRALSESHDNSVVIEDFIAGHDEFSVEILTWDGQPQVLAVTDKETTGPPNFVETGHCQPSRQPEDVRAAIERTAIDGVRALGIDWSAAHAEVKIGPAGPIIIEIGARLGGDFITTELVPRSTGLDMVQGTIELALGREPALTTTRPPRGASIRYLTPSAGRVVEITGVEEARKMPGVAVVDIHVAAGDHIGALHSSLARIGHIIAEGATAEEAVARAEAARDMVRVTVLPD